MRDKSISSDHTRSERICIWTKCRSDRSSFIVLIGCATHLCHYRNIRDNLDVLKASDIVLFLIVFKRNVADCPKIKLIKVWVTDITNLRNEQDWLYLGRGSRSLARKVGCFMKPTLGRELFLNAPLMAVGCRRPIVGSSCIPIVRMSWPPLPGRPDPDSDGPRSGWCPRCASGGLTRTPIDHDPVFLWTSRPPGSILRRGSTSPRRATREWPDVLTLYCHVQASGFGEAVAHHRTWRAVMEDGQAAASLAESIRTRISTLPPSLMNTIVSGKSVLRTHAAGLH